MKRFHSRLRKVLPLGILSLLLLASFQNCRQSTGVDLKTTTSSSTTDPNAVTAVETGGTTPGASNPAPTPTMAPNPCPPSAMGNPVISDLLVVGTSTVATTVNATSGYTNMSGNVSSNPGVEVSLLATNVTPADICDQSVQVNCNIAVTPGSTGVLWGTSDRVQIANGDLECVTGSRNLDVDVAGKAPTNRPNKTTLLIRPKDQGPDLSAPTHVCMQGSATVTVTLRNPYNKNSEPEKFVVNLSNGCPAEQKINADNEAEAQGAFGEAVSISGSRAAVLTSGLNAFGLVNVGGVRIYEKSGANWQYVTTVIPPSTELEADKKAISVLLNNNNLVIGNAAINANAGRIWLFQRDVSGNWNKVATLDGAAGSKFGTSLAFDGSHLAVGAPAGNGSVEIYTLSGSTLSPTSTINGPDANSDFGSSIAVSGSRLVIGAPGSALNTTSTGDFHSCDISNIASPSCTKWALTGGKLGTETIPASSKLGSAVAIKGNLALIAAKGWYTSTADPIPAIRNGLVALVDLAASTVQVLKGGNEEIFGSAVDFAATSFFVGAKEGIGKRGFVDQFTLSGTPARRFRYYGLDQAPLDRIGASLAVSGSDLLVGAPLDQERAYSTAGSATFFTILNP